MIFGYVIFLFEDWEEYDREGAFFEYVFNCLEAK